MTQVQVNSPGALHWLVDGWHALRDKALQALTYFKPSDENETSADQRWAVLAADLVDHKDHLTLELEVPGMSKDDISIDLNDGVISIRGEKKSSSSRTVGSSVVTERAFGMFHRAVRLPCEVDAAKTTAEYTDGVLTVNIPKSSASMPRKIPIRQG